MKEHRILIVNVNWVGDVLFSTPAIRAIRKRYPQAYIACMVVPRCREALEKNPHLDELLIYDEKKEYKGLSGKLRLIASLKSRRFDTVFLFHRSLTRTLMVALSGIKERVGIDNPKRGFLLSKKVEPQRADIHKVEQFLNIVKAKDIPPAGRNMELFISKEDEVFAREYLNSQGVKEGKPVIVLNPGGNWNLKRWPAARFAELGDKLAGLFGAQILITGAEKDVELGNAITGMMKNRPVVTCGETTLRQLAAILRHADLVISNDSGPMHIAVSQSAKTIALFGPTDPKVTGPYGEGKYVVIQKPLPKPDCKIPCYNLRCEDNACMKAITVEDVIKEAAKLLK
jgi:lipopolysaccharide heptosyltransferase II